MTLMRLAGETFEQYCARTGLDHWATEAEHRADMQAYTRDYCRRHNPPHVVAELERAWEKLDREA